MKWLLAIIVGGIFTIPLLFLIFQSFSFESDVLSTFISTQLLEVIVSTFVLAPLIAILTTLIGGFWGYLFATYEFPLRRALLWLLCLPMAIPIYVFAFTYLGVWENFVTYSKPVWLLVLVFIFANYPYTFLLSLQAFSRESQSLKETSQLIGLDSKKYFWLVRWPLARPLLLAGFFIIANEFLSDFGAVSIFGVNTFSTAIYKLWVSYQSLPTASVLALSLLILVAIMLWAQSKIKGYSSKTKPITRVQSGWQITFGVFGFLVLALFIPIAQLVAWAVKVPLAEWLSVHIFNTAALSLIFSSGVVLLLAFAIFLVSRYQKTLTTLLQFGYALPGTLLAVAVVIPFLYLQRHIDGISRGVVAGVILLFLTWFIRFLKVGWEPIAKARDSFPRNLEESAWLYVGHRLKRWWICYFPLLKGGLATSFLFLFLETARELPIALLTRPFGWDTLPIRIFEYTAESEWVRASPPALILIAFGCIGLLVTHAKDS